MIYIISILKDKKDGIINYTGIDTCSDSVINLKPEVLKSIILNNKVRVVNASIIADSIAIKKWANSIFTFISHGIGGKCSGATNVLLATKENNMYKVVDHEGNVRNLWEPDLRRLISHKNIANCDNKLRSEDIYNITTDREFVKNIESKYEIFTAKAALMGRGNAFNYDIENQEVRLTKYTGPSTDVILPSFITSIKKDAFQNVKIKSIKLNEGLRVIGTKAFALRETYGILDRIEIPETVELICNGAFLNNPRLIKVTGELNTDRFKLRNSNTIMLDQSINVERWIE